VHPIDTAHSGECAHRPAISAGKTSDFTDLSFVLGYFFLGAMEDTCGLLNIDVAALTEHI
jgi:hypothetical protein